LAIGSRAINFNARTGVRLVSQKENNMRLAWMIVAILMVLWLVGFGLHVAGSLIHLLLVVAVVVLLIDLLGGRRSTV
jgi:diacylglycerol kinase